MKTAADYQKKQQEKLREAARLAGYHSIYALAKAILNGEVKIKKLDKDCGR